MTSSAITWRRALRALMVATALVGVLLFVAANFVLVDLRLLGLTVETRLAWAVVVPAALGFLGGLGYSRLRRGSGKDSTGRGPRRATAGADLDR